MRDKLLQSARTQCGQLLHSHILLKRSVNNRTVALQAAVRIIVRDIEDGITRGSFSLTSEYSILYVEEHHRCIQF